MSFKTLQNCHLLNFSANLIHSNYVIFIIAQKFAINQLNENKWAAIIQQKFCMNTNEFTSVWTKAIYLAVEKKIQQKDVANKWNKAEHKKLKNWKQYHQCTMEVVLMLLMMMWFYCKNIVNSFWIHFYAIQAI